MASRAYCCCAGRSDAFGPLLGQLELHQGLGEAGRRRAASSRGCCAAATIQRLVRGSCAVEAYSRALRVQDSAWAESAIASMCSASTARNSSPRWSRVPPPVQTAARPSRRGRWSSAAARVPAGPGRPRWARLAVDRSPAGHRLPRSGPAGRWPGPAGWRARPVRRRRSSGRPAPSRKRCFGQLRDRRSSTVGQGFSWSSMYLLLISFHLRRVGVPLQCIGK